MQDRVSAAKRGCPENLGFWVTEMRSLGSGTAPGQKGSPRGEGLRSFRRPGDAEVLGTGGPRNGGLLGWASSGRNRTRKATYGLLGTVPYSSAAEPATGVTKKRVQGCRGTGPRALGACMGRRGA